MMTETLPPVGLPNRRLQITDVVEWHGMEWLVGIGFDHTGVAKEAFVKVAAVEAFVKDTGTRRAKSGAQLEALADDCCIVLSKLLQRGERVQDLVAALFPLGAETGQAPPTLLAQIVRSAARIEREEATAIRDAYDAVRSRFGRLPA